MSERSTSTRSSPPSPSTDQVATPTALPQSGTTICDASGSGMCGDCRRVLVVLFCPLHLPSLCLSPSSVFIFPTLFIFPSRLSLVPPVSLSLILSHLRPSSPLSLSITIPPSLPSFQTEPCCREPSSSDHMHASDHDQPSLKHKASQSEATERTNKRRQEEGKTPAYVPRSLYRDLPWLR